MEPSSDVPADSMIRNFRVVDVVRKERQLATTDSTFGNQNNASAIAGYAQEPLLPLSEACAPLMGIIYNLMFYVEMAINATPEQPPDGLTVDESAAIRLYTIEWEGESQSLYTTLNYSLKKGDRNDLQPYFKYMKLFLTALAKLPCAPALIVWRGITKNLSAELPRGTQVTWWAFSSCTTELTVLKNNMYLGSIGDRTLLSIETINGRSIKAHSHYKTEDEILLLPGSEMIVQSQFNPTPDLYIIHLKQVKPKEVLLEPPFEGAFPYSKTDLAVRSSWKRNERLFTGFCLLTMLIFAVIVTLGILGAGEPDNKPKGLRWQQNGKTVAGGNGRGNQSNQIRGPLEIYVDANQTVYVLENNNSRIVKWKKDAKEGEIILGENREDNRTDQLQGPTDMIIDEENNILTVSDNDGSRVVQWPFRNATSGKTIISNGDFSGLAMDKNGYLYASSNDWSEVRRWRIGDKNGTLIAGGHGNGSQNNQFFYPYYIFVDQDFSLYVSDSYNHRVMKWVQNATEGVVVAGCGSSARVLTCLSYPGGIFVDDLGTLYVVDTNNFRVVSWSKGASEGSIVVGATKHGNGSDQLFWPTALSFDQQKNLYVADYNNNRIQKFNFIDDANE